MELIKYLIKLIFKQRMLLDITNNIDCILGHVFTMKTYLSRPEL